MIMLISVAKHLHRSCKNKMRLSLILLLFHTLSSFIYSAANDELPDVEALFTANVEIVESTDNHPQSNIRSDNDARILVIGDRDYSYPVEIKTIFRFQFRQDQVLLEVIEPLPDTDQARSRSRQWVWSFDLQTETFLRLLPSCNNPAQLSLRDVEARWIYVTGVSTDQTHLCETASGHKSDPLPVKLWQVQPPFSTEPLPVFESPDNRWLLLFGEADNQTWVYSYDIQAQRLMDLGRIACNFCIERGSVEWFGTTVTIWSLNPEDDSIAIFSANVAEADSLNLAITRPHYSPAFYDDPPRYDYVNFTTPEDIWETQCQRVIYDILTGQKQVTEMGSLCRPEWGHLDGTGYYRDVRRGAEGIAALTSFNGDTLESAVLYEGEIEWIDWISPDGRYAVVVLDNSGFIDTPPFLDPLFSWGIPQSPTLAYVDLSTQQVMFEIATGWNGCDAPLGGPNFNWSAGLSATSLQPCISIGPTGAIFPRGDNHFLAIGDEEPTSNEAVFGFSTQFADLISIDGGNISHTRLLEGELIPYTADYILSRNWDETNRTISLSLIPVDNSPPIQITHEIPLDNYRQLMVTDIYPARNEMRLLIQTTEGNAAYVTVRIVPLQT